MARADQVRSVDDYLAPRPSRFGGQPRRLQDDICELAYCVGRGNYPADFLAAAIRGLSAGWRAFSASGFGYFAARASRPLAPSMVAESSRPASSASPDSSQPASPASPVCNSRSRNQQKRRLAREAAAKDLASKLIRDAEAAAVLHLG